MNAPSNFDFLRDVPEAPPGLYESAVRVERYAATDPRASAFYARFTLEAAVRWLAEHDAGVVWEDDEDSLGLVLHRMRTQGLTSRDLHRTLVRVKRHGDRATHATAQPVTDSDALDAVEGLHHVLRWVAVKQGWIRRAVAFVRDLVRPAPVQAPLTWAEVEVLERTLAAATADRDRLADDHAVLREWTDRVLADLDQVRADLVAAREEIGRLEGQVTQLRADLARSGSNVHALRQQLAALQATLDTREAAYRQLLAGTGLTSTRAFYHRGVLDFGNLLTIADADDRPDERDEAMAVALELLADRLDAHFRPHE